MSYTLRIWHKVKHDDGCVTEIYHQPGYSTQIDDLVKQGGFYAGLNFVPYHSISYIEVVDEDETEPERKSE